MNELVKIVREIQQRLETIEQRLENLEKANSKKTLSDLVERVAKNRGLILKTNLKVRRIEGEISKVEEFTKKQTKEIKLKVRSLDSKLTTETKKRQELEERIFKLEKENAELKTKLEILERRFEALINTLDTHLAELADEMETENDRRKVLEFRNQVRKFKM